METDLQATYWRPFPKVVRIEPAGACNLSCSHCPTGTISMVRGVMAPQTFAVVLDAIKQNLERVKVVVLYHGGEPLLNKAFGEMARSVKALGIPFVKTVSNGMLLSDERIDEIIQSGLDAIEFSLDGENAATNNFVRRKSDYETIVRNVKRLIDRKRELRAHHLKVFLSSTQFIDPATYRLGQPAEAPGSLRAEFGGSYAGEVADFKCTFAMRWPRMEVDENLYDVFYDPFDHDTANDCDHVDSTLTVRWNGDVVACCYDLTSEHVLGNANQESLERIWNGDRYLQLRASIKNRSFIELCNNCNVVRPNVFLILRNPRKLETASGVRD